MARMLKFTVTLEVRINESDYALLRYLAKRVDYAQKPVLLTAHALADAIQMSVPTARRSSKKLASTGLIVMRGQQRQDGGRDANTYEITQLGFEVLKLKAAMRPRHVTSIARQS